MGPGRRAEGQSGSLVRFGNGGAMPGSFGREMSGCGEAASLLLLLPCVSPGRWSCSPRRALFSAIAHMLTGLLGSASPSFAQGCALHERPFRAGVPSLSSTGVTWSVSLMYTFLTGSFSTFPVVPFWGMGHLLTWLLCSQCSVAHTTPGQTPAVSTFPFHLPGIFQTAPLLSLQLSHTAPLLGAFN